MQGEAIEIYRPDCLTLVTHFLTCTPDKISYGVVKTPKENVIGTYNIILFRMDATELYALPKHGQCNLHVF